jgi:hypothetical protein
MHQEMSISSCFPTPNGAAGAFFNRLLAVRRKALRRMPGKAENGKKAEFTRE